jgi:hypothetical protein
MALTDWQFGQLVRRRGGRGTGSIDAIMADNQIAVYIPELHSECGATPMDSPGPWTGHLTKPAQVHVCEDGWVCEKHPDQGWPHNDCAGPGMPCLTAIENLRQGCRLTGDPLHERIWHDASVLVLAKATGHSRGNSAQHHRAGSLYWRASSERTAERDSAVGLQRTDRLCLPRSFGRVCVDWSARRLEAIRSRQCSDTGGVVDSGILARSSLRSHQNRAEWPHSMVANADGRCVEPRIPGLVSRRRGDSYANCTVSKNCSIRWAERRPRNDRGDNPRRCTTSLEATAHNGLGLVLTFGPLDRITRR